MQQQSKLDEIIAKMSRVKLLLVEMAHGERRRKPRLEPCDGPGERITHLEPGYGVTELDDCVTHCDEIIIACQMRENKDTPFS